MNFKRKLEIAYRLWGIYFGYYVFSYFIIVRYLGRPPLPGCGFIGSMIMYAIGFVIFILQWRQQRHSKKK